MLQTLVSSLYIAAAVLAVGSWWIKRKSDTHRFPFYLRWRLAICGTIAASFCVIPQIYYLAQGAEVMGRTGLMLATWLLFLFSNLSELRRVWSQAMRERVQAQGEKKVSFVWQGILILLPVFFLTGLGIYSLRQDKETIRRETLEQAETLAEELNKSLERIVVSGGSSVSADPNDPFPEVKFRDAVIHLAAFSSTYIPRFAVTFDQKHLLERNPLNLPTLQVDSPSEDPIYKISVAEPNLQVAVFKGDFLVYPAAFASSPVANDPFTNLSTNQLKMLRTAKNAAATDNLDLAEKEYTQLLKTELPDSAARNVEFELAQIVLKSGFPDKAREHFVKVAEKARLVQTPSGIPLLPLARFKSAEIICQSAAPLERKRDALALAGAAAVYFPSVLSEPILQQLQSLERALPATGTLVTGEWWKVWQTHQTSRELVAKKSSHAAGWIAHGVQWRFAHLPGSHLNVFKAQSLSNLKQRVDNLLETTRKHPAYFDFGVQIGGHSFRNIGTNQIISSTQTISYGGEQVAPTIQATVAVARPELLFSHYRKRQLWAGALIGGAALSSVVGFGAAFLSFRRQLRLNEMKSDFVSSVSHELRTPIASIRLMAEGLETGRIKEPEKQKEYFRFIDRECRRLSSLIENVLDFSRIEQGRKQYEFEPTDLTKMIAETVKLMEPYANEKKVSLCCDLSSTHGQAIIDGRAMQQAVINLLDNAVKHSPPGEAVMLRVEDAKNDSRTTHVRLTVEDHGPGIPQHEHGRIFERFYRLGSELRRETQGVGIGLSIVKHIAEAHDGRVWVESEVGKGSRFIVELPVTNGEME